jgi:peptidoglycan hydrolase-like amidase
MKDVAVGIVSGAEALDVELLGDYADASGARVARGARRIAGETVLRPADPASAFAIDGVTIGIGFHWERRERQVFHGGLRVLARPGGLTAVNDVPLEEYVTSVISSEMSASCPAELLKAHAVISRSWLRAPQPGGVRSEAVGSGELRRWYDREAHADFDVCADDHCQRYQGFTKAFSRAASEAVRATEAEVLVLDGAICDARFSKACGGITELYSTAWDDRDVPYLASVPDGPVPTDLDAGTFLRSRPPAHCATRDADLLARILPGFDRETRDFYRWTVSYSPEELGALVASRLGVDLGPIAALEPLARGPSTRIHRLRLRGARGELVVGKELEIRRALSTSHLLSSAFVAGVTGGRVVVTGGGWGHGVGLCQIGAAVLADRGTPYREILGHYYRGAAVERRDG